ncbi:MerR family DNA-binding protein [Nonomuraea sp. NPDC050783]|uniref:MerR family DNA-binding protein n=1 Tax=Nonomuraea sp. NPDC050783 TaxID=3154634 RepID=UPI0034665B1B
MIRRRKEAGFTLKELRTLLTAPSPLDHRDLLRRHVQELEQRISQARAAKELIEHALACPHSFAERGMLATGSPHGFLVTSTDVADEAIFA